MSVGRSAAVPPRWQTPNGFVHSHGGPCVMAVPWPSCALRMPGRPPASSCAKLSERPSWPGWRARHSKRIFRAARGALTSWSLRRAETTLSASSRPFKREPRSALKLTVVLELRGRLQLVLGGADDRLPLLGVGIVAECDRRRRDRHIMLAHSE